MRLAGRFYETNALRTEEAVQRFVPWIVGTFCAFSLPAISSSDIRFPSIALIFLRQVESRCRLSSNATVDVSGRRICLLAATPTPRGVRVSRR